MAEPGIPPNAYLYNLKNEYHMKQIILAVTLIAAIFTSALAGERPTKAENAAAMKTGRTLLTAKTSELETTVNNHNIQAAQNAATEVLALMRKGMAQTNVEINFQTGDQQKAGFAHYNDLEKVVYEYTLLSKNVAANGKQLVEHAQAFIKKY